MFTFDLEIIGKKHLWTFHFYKNNFKTIQKLFRFIITIQKYGDRTYTLVVEIKQYSEDVSKNVSVWSCSLSKRSLTARPEQSSLPSQLGL